MKVLTEKIFSTPLCVGAWNTIGVYHDTELILERTIYRDMSIVKVVIFEIEESDGLGGVGIGGAFIEEVK